MLGPLRTLISVAFLVLVLWAAFTVKLGGHTFAQHIDRIGQTEEARALIDGARSRVKPGLEEVKQRVLGEYVEAPTHVPSAPPPRAAVAATAAPVSSASIAAPRSPARDAAPSAPRAASAPAHATRASTAPATHASTADSVKLPGRRARADPP